MRSLLTAIGIVIGIASVIAMVNIGKGASTSITESVSALGSNTLYIMPGQQHGPGGASSIVKAFKQKDVDVIKESVLVLDAVSPHENAGLTVLYKDKNHHTSVRGVNNDYFDVQKWALKGGRTFARSELRAGQNVCIIGKTVIQELFNEGDSPVGAKIRLRNFSCEVIGVLETKGANTFGQDQDDLVLVPIKMFQRRISGNDNIHLIMALVKENIPLEEAKLQIEQLMRERRHVKAEEEDNFSVRSMTALVDTISKITSVLTVMLGAVAAISLVVGGIGIMNIMLVSVSERTREIGLRMALGARPADVLQQFLAEALLVSLGGCFIGLVAGIGTIEIVKRLFQLNSEVTAGSILISFAVSLAVGVFFGFYPARKAARLEPIEALRYQ